MEMPRVSTCAATGCAFNKDKICHAIAITVGDGATPHCDTFFDAAMKGGEASIIGGIGACKVSSCKYNKHLTCSAPNIQVGFRDGDVRCLTFTT